MGRRRWCALLLLAAVFAMHGVQCVAAVTDAPAHSVSALSVSAPAHDGHPAGAPGSDRVPDHERLPGHDGAPAGAGHGPVDHLGAVCLAVLAAASLVVLAVLLGRASPGSPAPPRVPTAGLWRRLGELARPPELSALGLLRI